MNKKSYNRASSVELVKSGSNFFKKAVAIIRNSKEQLHLQTYILADDSTGLQVIHELAEAVKRGVTVYLLVDAFGSHDLKRHTIRNIRESGIHFRTYSPLISGYHLRFGRRLHHKILVSDEKEALIGGINIDDHYHIKGNYTPWLDYAVYVTGDVCEEIYLLCRRLWLRRSYFKRRKITHKEPSLHHISVVLDQNDWLYGKKQVSKSINNAIRHAHSSITIVSSYFIPGRKIRKSLRNAARRKVDIKLILPGISDVKLVKYAMVYWYSWLLRNNIRLYEWTGTILHGKLMLADNDWVSIGSFNINHLSNFSSIETNLEIKNNAFARTVKAELDDVIAQCTPLTSAENHKRMRPSTMFVCWCSFKIVRFLFAFQFAVLSKE